MMTQLGVTPKQAERARQAFQKSAVHAGFIDQATGRFIKPGATSTSNPDKPAQDKSRDEKFGGDGGGDDDQTLALDPLLLALLRKIPAQAEGWSAAKRVRWFRAFAMNVSQVFDDDDAPVELKIEIDKETSAPSV